MITSTPIRTCFFVDGFNLYHSICDAQKILPGKQLKWLDIHNLCKKHLHLIGHEAVLSQVSYFTAYAYHLAYKNPNKISRHKAYTRALTATGVKVNESHFKKKDVYDAETGKKIIAHEEKETDVALACAVLEEANKGSFDTAVIVTGDTDLRPVISTFGRMNPEKKLLFAFPFGRKNKELAKISPDSFAFSAESYAKHQFPDKVLLPSGKFVHKPKEW